MVETSVKKSNSLLLSIEAFITLKLFYGLSLLPFPVLKLVGKALANIAWYLNGKGAKVTKANIQRCYPDLDAHQQYLLAKSSFQHVGSLFAELCMIYHKPREWTEKLVVETKGIEVMEGAVASQKGVIVLAPHMGNWELFSHILPRFGKVSGLYRPLKKAFFEELVCNVRVQEGAELIPISRRGMITLIKAINQGGITWIMPDQSPDPGNGEYAPFYGYSTYTMTLVYSLLKRCDSEIVFALNERTNKGFITHYMKPDPDIYSDDKATSLAALNRSIEACVAICPEQFQWEYKRFKNNAPDQPVFYNGF